MRILLPTLGLLFGLGLLDLGFVATASAQHGQQVQSQHVNANRRNDQVRYDPRRVRNRRGHKVEVPELDPSAAVQGLALIAGLTLLMSDRKQRRVLA